SVISSPGIVLLALLMSDVFVMRKMVSSMPICTPGSFQCQVLLSDLFDRAVKLSHYIHSLSTEMYEDLDQQFSQGRQILGKAINSCHTSSLSTPEDKDQALQTHHDDLINLVQKLLRSWNQPLQHLALEAPDNMASKVKEVEEHAKILQGGIDRIAGRMQSNLGDDFYPQWFGPMDSRMPNGDSESYALYHMLHCFRRDANKIDNYLKILRCRMVHASNC
ncbi:prolactin-2, partial [Xenopus laevis]|uniref:Prolactin-2 n=1 Tax=Xenopus laevis TaxID=8355 RepID=A0A8J0T9Y6_XENLA